MNTVDVAVFELLEAGGLWVPMLHEDDPEAVAPANAVVIHDGLVGVDNTTNVVTYPVPYGVYHSSLGDEPESESNQRLAWSRGRMSVFFTMTYVGLDRWQARRTR